MATVKEKYAVEFMDHLFYDETSPSCLRWKSDRFGGVHGKIVVAAMGSVAGTLSKQHNRYIVSIMGTKYQAAIIVCKLKCVEGHEELGSMVVDHIDKDSTNNVVSNLRVVTQEKNTRNSGKRSSNKTGKPGVYFTTKKCGSTYAVAIWTDLSRKTYSKWFSVKKLGREEAFRLASVARDAAIDGMNARGAGYTEDHR
jgi:hypothetical protein